MSKSAEEIVKRHEMAVVAFAAAQGQNRQVTDVWIRESRAALVALIEAGEACREALEAQIALALLHGLPTERSAIAVGAHDAARRKAEGE